MRRERLLYNHQESGSVDLLAADAELERTLEDLSDAKNYSNWIYDLTAPHLGHRVLEVGAGHGTMTELFIERAEKVVATDVTERCADLLSARFSGDPRVDVMLGKISEAAEHGPFDSAVLINVLEHIEDDDEALAQLSGLLKPGGRLVLWVPAFALLYSDFDRRIGHYRRYQRKNLAAQLMRSGYEVVDIRYVNPIGAVGWFFIARLAKRVPNRRVAMIFDRYLVPVVSRIEKKFRPPFGQSVFAVAIKTSDGYNGSTQ
ncbi:MAG: class I SAM-dependent methyltransferase [Acidimicrobiales bacterium]